MHNAIVRAPTAGFSWRRLLKCSRWRRYIPDVLECSRLLKPIVPVFELFAAPGPPDCGPVEDVEEEEQHWEDDQEGQVRHLMGEQHVSEL